MKKILLAEDDPEINDLMALHLNTAVYQLTSCSNGAEALDATLHEMFHLVILDIMLPGLNGMEICKRLRQRQPNIPVMMLTCRSEESDKVLALELGADDYVTKPFGILELLARIKALLRRADQHQAETNAAMHSISVKDMIIDTDKRCAQVSGHRLELTPKEFDLLLLLASHPGKTFSRQQLLTLIWGYAFSGYEHTITAHINRLRIKLETDLQHPQYILTSWGVGYRFTE